MANHGGKRKGAGRPSKAKEEQVRRLGLDAINSVFGSIEDYYKHIAEESKESFPHLKLLQEYVFGKPKETVLIESEEVVEDYDYSKLSTETIRELAKLEPKPNESES